MKKNVLLIAGVLFSLLAQKNLMAQSASTPDFKDVKSVNLLNAGVGLGSYGLYGTGGLPLTASFEHGFTKNISAGIEAGFVQRKYAYDWKYTYLIFGARGSYHFNEALKIENPKIDVYGGAGLLYRHYSFNYKQLGSSEEPAYNASSSAGTVDFELHAGARYLFNNHVGAYAELGYGISPLQIGVALKF